MPEPRISFAGYRRALRFIVPYWPRLVLVLLTGIAATGLGLLQPYISKLLIDDAVVWTMDMYEQRWPVWTNGDGMEGPVDVTQYVAGRNFVSF